MPLWYLIGRRDAIGIGRPSKSAVAESCTLRANYFPQTDSGASSLPLSANTGNALLQIRNQILAFAGNMNGFTLARFGTNPPGQLFRGRKDASAFTPSRHAFEQHERPQSGAENQQVTVSLVFRFLEQGAGTDIERALATPSHPTLVRLPDNDCFPASSIDVTDFRSIGKEHFNGTLPEGFETPVELWTGRNSAVFTTRPSCLGMCRER
jgi:hypothetical protein